MESLMKDSRIEKELEDVLERQRENVLNLEGEGMTDDVISMDLLDALVKQIVVYSPERVKVTYAFSDELEEWIRKLQTDAPQEREYLRFENAHEAIVSKEVFDTAQKSIQIRGKRGTYKKAENSHALQGKVKCGCCGYSMNRSGKGKNASYLCRMGDSCGSHLRIRVQDLEDTVLEILGKLVSVQREAEVKREENRCRAISEIMKIREEKRILEMKIEHCKTSRLNLYRQWKEQQITKNDYIRKRDEYTVQEDRHQTGMQNLDKQLEELMVEQEKKPAHDLQIYSSIQPLTREMADELVERIDVYGENRVEVDWKFESPIEF